MVYRKKNETYIRPHKKYVQLLIFLFFPVPVDEAILDHMVVHIDSAVNLVSVHSAVRLVDHTQSLVPVHSLVRVAYEGAHVSVSIHTT